MQNFEIKLVSINDVKDFVNLTLKFGYDLDLVSGRYHIDAKSIMGILSLDLSKPITLVAHSDDTKQLEAEIERFRV